MRQKGKEKNPVFIYYLIIYITELFGIISGQQTTTRPETKKRMACVKGSSENERAL